MRISCRAGLAPADFEITAMLQIAIRRSRSKAPVQQAGMRLAIRVVGVRSWYRSLANTEEMNLPLF